MLLFPSVPSAFFSFFPLAFIFASFPWGFFSSDFFIFHPFFSGFLPSPISAILISIVQGWGWGQEVPDLRALVCLPLSSSAFPLARGIASAGQGRKTKEGWRERDRDLLRRSLYISRSPPFFLGTMFPPLRKEGNSCSSLFFFWRFPQDGGVGPMGRRKGKKFRPRKGPPDKNKAAIPWRSIS